MAGEIEEELNFTRSGVIRIYEKMKAGTMTEEDFHRAAANTEAILKEGGADLKVQYMGVPEERTFDSILLSLKERGLDVRDFIKFRPKLQQTKLFEE